MLAGTFEGSATDARWSRWSAPLVVLQGNSNSQDSNMVRMLLLLVLPVMLVVPQLLVVLIRTSGGGAAAQQFGGRAVAHEAVRWTAPRETLAFACWLACLLLSIA